MYMHLYVYVTNEKRKDNVTYNIRPFIYIHYYYIIVHLLYKFIRKLVRLFDEDNGLHIRMREESSWE